MVMNAKHIIAVNLETITICIKSTENSSMFEEQTVFLIVEMAAYIINIKVLRIKII